MIHFHNCRNILEHRKKFGTRPNDFEYFWIVRECLITWTFWSKHSWSKGRPGSGNHDQNFDWILYMDGSFTDSDCQTKFIQYESYFLIMIYNLWIREVHWHSSKSHRKRFVMWWNTLVILRWFKIRAIQFLVNFC